MCELTDRLNNIVEWPEGSRAICRCGGSRPATQLIFTDVDRYGFQVFITDQDDEDIGASHLLR